MKKILSVYEIHLYKLYYSIPFISYNKKRSLIMLLHWFFPTLTEQTISYNMLHSDDECRGKFINSYIVEPVDLQKDTISFVLPEKPLISVIMPVYCKLEYTLKCLKSIYNANCNYPFEIIVVDDMSLDDTRKTLEDIQGIRVISNVKNLGFIKSCNKGASFARGGFLLFLNNDTQVMTGWLDALVDSFEEEPEAGGVGSMLIYPDGVVQEAGCIVFQDGSSLPVGGGRPSSHYHSNKLTEADYCSAASLMIPKEIFIHLGGFDELYEFGYYEDVDLAFSMRKMGKKVFCQPFSRVIHLQNITCGCDETGGMKHFQIKNLKRFCKKWRLELKRQPSKVHM